MNPCRDGTLRVAEPAESGWTVNQWLKKAVLLSFRLNDNAVMDGAHSRFYDKVPMKYADYSADEFATDTTKIWLSFMLKF